MRKNPSKRYCWFVVPTVKIWSSSPGSQLAWLLSGIGKVLFTSEKSAIAYCNDQMLANPYIIKAVHIHYEVWAHQIK